MWVTIALHDGESLICDKCDEEIHGSNYSETEVHLCVDGDNEVDEVVCSDCWEKRK